MAQERPALLSATASRADQLGSNQTGMRAHNERLVLSLIRRSGPLAKAEIARRTGLSAQAVSVIIRSLEAEGFLARGEAVRGRVGQPSVPMRLAPDGAYFFGLKVGRRSLELVLTDFVGTILGARRQNHRYPTPEAAVDFSLAGARELSATLPDRGTARIAGLGISMPFFLWDWADALGVPAASMAPWRERDISAELSAALPFPVLVENDASSACNAELIFGNGDLPRDFMYVYVGYFAGGGLVLNGSLYTGPTGNAAALGPLPIPSPNGGRPLMSIASLSVLERMLQKNGAEVDTLWTDPERWSAPADIVEPWAKDAGQAIAYAGAAGSALLDIGTLVLDGSMPASLRDNLVEHVKAALPSIDYAGITRTEVVAGTIGTAARALGAASIPLAARFLVDPNAVSSIR